MRLAEFIEENREPILVQWAAFAATRGRAGGAMTPAALRDHAQAMLRDIVSDLRTPQTQAGQTEKAKGYADSNPDVIDTAAEVHGAARAASGFSIGEMVSEFRALRASVIQLWTTHNGTLTGDDFEDLIRFNEAIDQATAESLARFTLDLDRSREMFLAILGHDLQTPIGAIMMSSQFMLDTTPPDDANASLSTAILRSARRMNAMVRNLLDLTRSRLGPGIPIVRAPMNMADIARHAVEEVSVAHPERRVEMRASGDPAGEWDAARLGQVLANLLGNAIQYGDASTEITLTVEGEATAVELRVHNAGPPIPPSDVPGLFNPFKRLGAGAASGDSTSLGLGLYIAERIITAHAGTITVHSSAATGTVFTIRLPR